MKAAAYHQSLSIDRPEMLVGLTLPESTLGPRDPLVEAHAIPVNPVDMRVHLDIPPVDGQPHVLGWDAVDVVRTVGAEVSLFRPDDTVQYVNALQRPGTNNELYVVDEHVIDVIPVTLGFTRAAALPPTVITAWELLSDWPQVPEPATPSGKTVLIVDATGGVGSVLTQPTRRLTGLAVISAASHPGTATRVRKLDIYHMTSRTQSLAAELHYVDIPVANYVAGPNQTEHHFKQIVEALKPQGRLALTDDPAQLDVHKLKAKSLSLCWGFIYTCSIFGTGDQIEQHRLLNRIAMLINEGALRFAVNEYSGTISTASLKRA